MECKRNTVLFLVTPYKILRSTDGFTLKSEVNVVRQPSSLGDIVHSLGEVAYVGGGDACYRDTTVLGQVY